MKKHIDIYPANKAECCGCTACLSVCPKKCISMMTDELGLQYPVVNEDDCIECGACIKVCPFIHPYDEATPIANYAAKNTDEKIRMNSSSGGVFYALAEYTIAKGGIVFGAVFDEAWNVHHVWSDNIEGILPMMGSKYLQSRIEPGTLVKVQEFLKDGRHVLFTGTPCQIAGLKHFLKKEYDNLLAVEVICHGVPAPAVWQKYLEETFVRPTGGREKNTVLPPPLKDTTSTIVDVKFRDKSNGWKKFGFALLVASEGGDQNSVLPICKKQSSFYEPFQDNPYMKAFLQNWSLRPSCYFCKAKSGVSHADITIGDFWGIENYELKIDDDKGISCVICRSDQGYKLLDSIGLQLREVDYKFILDGNLSLEHSVSYTAEAKKFMNKFQKNGFYSAFNSIIAPSFNQRLLHFVRYKTASLILRIKELANNSSVGH